MLHNMLPLAYIHHAEVFYTEVMRLNRTLETLYTVTTGNLQEYVTTVRVYRQVVANKEQYSDQYLHVQSLARLLEDWQVKHSFESENLAKNVSPAWYHLLDALSSFEDRIEDTSKVYIICIYRTI